MHRDVMLYPRGVVQGALVEPFQPITLEQNDFEHALAEYLAAIGEERSA